MMQTAKGKAQDKRKTAKIVLNKSEKNIARWRKHKNRLDLEGIDTKQKANVQKTNKKSQSKTTTISKRSKVAQWKKPSKTEVAKNKIRADYAKHGKDTGVAMRAYVEGKISYSTYQKYATQGMKIYNKSK